MSKLYDLHMLVLLDGGRERTEAEYHMLLGEAGFSMTTIIPTTLPRSLIEAGCTEASSHHGSSMRGLYSSPGPAS